MAMRIGPGHGGSAGELLTFETREPEGLPDPVPEEPTSLGAKWAGQHPTTGKFLPGNKLQRKRGSDLLFSIGGAVKHKDAPQDLRQFLRWGRKWARARRIELAKMAGGQIGAGVVAIIESAALALCQARYLSYLAGQAAGNPDPKRGESASELMQRSVAMSDKARVADITAYELAVREAKARPQNTPNELLLQGLAQPAQPA